MAVILTLLLVCQSPPAKGSVLGGQRPRAMKPGDFVKIDTGIPGTGVPAIRLWSRDTDTGDYGFSELEYWAFCKSLEAKDPMENVHYMGDRDALRYLSTGTLVRVVLIHDDWGLAPIEKMRVAEVSIIPTGGWVQTDEQRIAAARAKEPVAKRHLFTWAIPLPYLESAGPRRETLAKLPLLRLSRAKHEHKYCLCQRDDAVLHTHVDALLYPDAAREWLKPRPAQRPIGSSTSSGDR